MSEVVRDIIWLPATRPSAKQILSQVAERRGLTVDDLTGPRKMKPIARARQEAMWEIYTRTNLSLPQIGKRLGGRDHTTILHGVRQHAARLAEVSA